MNLLESLKEYLDNVPIEKFSENWVKLKNYKNIGPNVYKYIDYLKEAGIYKEHKHNKD